MTSPALIKKMQSFNASPVKAHNVWSKKFVQMLGNKKLSSDDWKKSLKKAESELMAEVANFQKLVFEYKGVITDFHGETKQDIASCATLFKSLTPGSSETLKSALSGISIAEKIKKDIGTHFRALQAKIPKILQDNRDDLLDRGKINKVAEEAGLSKLLNKYSAARKKGIDTINAAAKDKNKVNDYEKRAGDFVKAFERYAKQNRNEKGKLNEAELNKHIESMFKELKESFDFFNIDGFRNKRSNKLDQIDQADAKLNAVDKALDPALAQKKANPKSMPDVSKPKGDLKLLVMGFPGWVKHVANTYSTLLVHEKRILQNKKILAKLPLEKLKKGKAKKPAIWLEDTIPELEKAVKFHKIDGKKYKAELPKIKKQIDGINAKFAALEKT